MLWPWLARTTQSDGSVESGEGGEEREGLGFIEKRCLALSVTALLMSINVTLRDLRRGHCIYLLVLVVGSMMYRCPHVTLSIS